MPPISTDAGDQPLFHMILPIDESLLGLAKNIPCWLRASPFQIQINGFTLTDSSMDLDVQVAPIFVNYVLSYNPIPPVPDHVGFVIQDPSGTVKCHQEN